MTSIDSKMRPGRDAATPPALSWKSALGRLERITLGLFVLWRLVAWLAPAAAFLPFLLFFFPALWVAVRWSRRLVQVAVWRLRNRLLLSYVFIAVVPVFLLGVLGVFGAWALSGQVAVYLVSLEFQQDIDMLRGQSRTLLRSIDNNRGGNMRLTGFLSNRFPGVQILLTHGTEEVLRFPEGVNLTHPPGDKADFHSAVLKDNLLYLGLHSGREGDKITILVPITKKYLQTLIPNLGEITVVDLSGAEQPKRLSMRLHDAPGNENDDFLSARAIAPAVNALDFQVLWGMPINLFLWDVPAKQEGSALLGVHTRISQVFRVIFSQKADWDQPWLIYAFYLVAGLFLFVEIVALVVGISITGTITRAVHYLYESTQRVQAGDFSYRIPVRGHDQLAELGRSFNMMAENLDRLLKVAKEKERLQADLDIAREVQEQLYPRTAPTIRGLQIVAMLDPAKSVSGDFYDYQRVADHEVAIVIGDVSGKGISAALLMANLQSATRSQMRMQFEQKLPVHTSALVTQINKHLQANTTTEKYSTFFFSVYNEETRELRATNAGHLPPILLRNGQASRLDVNGMVVGIFSHAKYDESRLTLQPGDLLILYTDGITEAENEYGEMFGEDLLIETVLRISDKPIDEILNTVFAAVRQWTYAPETSDDMTMMLIRGI